MCGYLAIAAESEVPPIRSLRIISRAPTRVLLRVWFWSAPMAESMGRPALCSVTNWRVKLIMSVVLTFVAKACAMNAFSPPPAAAAVRVDLLACLMVIGM